MLQLIDIKKDYEVAGEKVHALKGISLNFRKSEFVSILGASGCGKTTLLNIIGGLDKYTSGDLIIEGTSTKKYGDRDWDTYRNHSIGFIFQSYHLIPHQTILQNVELALMIAGVSKEERRRRAIEALDKVGLKDKIHNRPNQLSGGQAQRVAIARALINDPEIVLADEPTGALDSVTSVQIMELLKKVSAERLVIMVTHNPELAEQYSTRIVRLKDGEVIDDSLPYDGAEESFAASENFAEAAAENGNQPEETEGQPKKTNKGKKEKTSMSVKMAFGLSLKNLLSKRKRTAMVSVAGSIGIIGVSMVLAISSGVQGYINNMENDMLSGYPVSVTQSAYDFTSLMELNGSSQTNVDLDKLASGDRVYVNSLLKTLGTFSTGFEKTNNLTDAYIKYVEEIPDEYVNLIQYGYDFNIVNNIYTDFTVSDDLASHMPGGVVPEGYSNTFNMSFAGIRAMYASVLAKVPEYSTWGSMISSVQTLSETPANYEYVMSQYDVLAIDRNGEVVTEGFTTEEVKALYESKNSLVMVVNNHQIDDLTLAQYGYFNEDDFLDYAFKGIDADKNSDLHLVGDDGIPYTEFVGSAGKKFTYYPNDCIYNHVYYTSYMTDAQLREDDFYKNFADVLINARNNGDEALKAAISQIVTAMIAQNPGFANMEKTITEKMYEDTHIPAEDELTDGFLANAYSTEYVVKDSSGKEFTLPSFEEKGAGKAQSLGVTVILQKKEDVSYGCLTSGFYYTNALTKYILETEKDSEIVKFVNDEANPPITEVPMYVDYYYVKDEEDGSSHYVLANEKGSIETGSNMMSEMIGSITGTAGKSALGAGLFGGDDTPTSIYIYPVDFEYKNKITDYLDAWNEACQNGTTLQYGDGSFTATLEEKDKITYTDTVGLIINMVNTMIQMITIALIAFTALSLVVSTVMIGIITYVSVVERVKEIGILRAVGARKKDIKRLFNAETFIIGLIAGLFGILVTYLLSIIVNIIVLSLAGFWGIAALPWWQAVIMVVLSIGLTLISGLIPASAAAKKDPVVALRTE